MSVVTVLGWLWSDAAYPQTPPRVVGVGGALTEIVYALGLEGLLVGVDSTSRYPAAAERLPQVGYQRTLSAEGLLALQPDRVLVTADAGPPAVMEQLRTAGVAIYLIPQAYSAAGAEDKIRAIAHALDADVAGERLVQDFQRRWRERQAQQSPIAPPPRVLFLLAHAGGSVMTAGAGTSADAMIRLAGGVNAAQGFSGYRALGAEAILAAEPALILTTTESLAALGEEVDALWRLPGLALTPAGKLRRLLALDSLYLLGFGPRLPEAVAAVARRLREGAD